MKKIIRYLCVLPAFLFFCAPVFSAEPFSDVPADPLYSPHIESLHTAHFITGDTVMGIPKGTFRPDGLVNRSEFAT